MSDNIIKSYGTILKGENKEIDEKLNNLPSLAKRIDLKLPEIFDGSFVWRNYIAPVFKQGPCGYCWAIASSAVVADRFALYTDNQVHEMLSVYELISCSFTDIDVKFLKNKDIKKDDKLQLSNIYRENKEKCEGNTVYDALSYFYVYGTTNTKCVNVADLNKTYGTKFKPFIDYDFNIPKCSMLLGPDYDTCADNKEAPRFFRIKNFYLVNSAEDQIKYEIYKFGPVIAGFKIYDSFLDDYDGTSIYMGPKSGEKYQGGHAIRVCGWGVENGIKYWLCINSWGYNWGINGMFKMKMGIPECQLEDNIYGLIPDLPNLKVPDYLDIGFSVDRLNKFRKLVQIDNESGYKISTIIKMLKGELSGDLTYLVSSNYQKDLSTFIAAKVDQDRTSFFEMQPYPINSEFLVEENPLEIYSIIFFVLFIIFNTVLIRIFFRKK
jgi:cathepsin B